MTRALAEAVRNIKNVAEQMGKAMSILNKIVLSLPPARGILDGKMPKTAGGSDSPGPLNRPGHPDPKTHKVLMIRKMTLERDESAHKRKLAYKSKCRWNDLLQKQAVSFPAADRLFLAQRRNEFPTLRVQYKIITSSLMIYPI